VNKKESKRILIFENDIGSIKLKDKKASARKTIIVSTLWIGIPVLIVYSGWEGQGIIN
jgi:hypothetical protein